MDSNLQYTNKDYTYIDYTILPEALKLEILEWRNDVRIRKLMASDEIISLDSHLKFIESLKSRNDKKYWLVKKGEDAIGTFNITINDSNDLICEPGYYLKPSLLDSGFGLDFHYNYKDFLFNILGFEKTTGYILVGNNNAFLMARFFGSEPYGVLEQNGKCYILMSLDKNDFNKIEPAKLTIQFAKFIKQNKTINWKNLIESINQ